MDTAAYKTFSRIMRGCRDIDDASNRYAKIKARIIMILFHVDTPVNFISMRRGLDIDFPFKCRIAENNGGYFPRIPYREQRAYDDCRNALQMLVEEKKVVCEWTNGQVTYRLDELMMLRMKASCA